MYESDLSKDYKVNNNEEFNCDNNGYAQNDKFYNVQDIDERVRNFDEFCQTTRDTVDEWYRLAMFGERQKKKDR